MAWTAPYTFTAGETLTAAKLNEQIRDNLTAVAPIGSLHWRMQAATTIETVIDGFVLEGNGVSVLRATYAALNTKLGGLGYPFGSVDATHMTLPDLQGRGPVAMAASGHTDANALGDSDGLTKTARTNKPSVSVNVALPANTGAEAAHTHGPGTFKVTLPTNGTYFLSSSTPSVSGGQDVAVGGTSAAGSSHTHPLGGSASGSGTAIVPYVVVGVLGVKF